MLRLTTFVLFLAMAAQVAPAVEGDALTQAQAAMLGADLDRRDRLESALREAQPAERAAIFALMSDKPTPGLDALYDIGLEDRDPAVRAAALGAVAKNWPTENRHLQIMRREIDSPDEQVAQAAMGAVAAIGDDRETGKILQRMETGGAVAAQARATLTRIYGSDLGDAVETWRVAFEERQQRLAPLLDTAQTVFQGQDHDAIRASLHQLLMLRNPPRSAVADAIAPLMHHADPIIAALARDGLVNHGGGIAKLIIKADGPVGDYDQIVLAKPIKLVPVAAGMRLPPSAPEGNTGWYVFGAFIGFGGAFVLLLLRSPLKNSAPVREATKAFRRQIENTHEFRQLKKATVTIARVMSNKGRGRMRTALSAMQSHDALEPKLKEVPEKGGSVFRKSDH